jgi:ATP-dependent Clp protease ATP-binding subunit ClpC
MSKHHFMNPDDTKRRYMKIPVLFWKIDNEKLVGQVVGTDYELIGEDQEKIKNQFVEFINRQYEKDPYMPLTEIDQPKLKIISFSFRPSYFNYNNSAFPTAESLNIKTPLVYGKGKHSTYECFLPLFNRSFQVNDPESIESNALTVATGHLQDNDPNYAYSILMTGIPWLDEIRVTLKWKEHNVNERQVAFENIGQLSAKAERLPPVKSVRQKSRTISTNTWERTESIDLVVEKIVIEKANLIISGEAGVGKTAVLNEAIRKISKEKGDQGVTFWRTTPRQIVAGSKYIGEWQENCKLLINDLKSIGGALWVEDLLSLLDVGGSGAEDSMAAFMLPYLKGKDFQIIGEMTPRQVDAFRKILPGFIEHFQIIRLDEMNQEKSLRIFGLFNDFCHRNYGVSIDKGALYLSYRLLKRFLPYERFPGKAIRFLGDIAGSAIDKSRMTVTENEVIEAFVQKTGLPEIFLRDEIKLDKDGLRNHFSSKIIGQDEAIKQISSVIKVFKAGINNPDKPIATMVFAGPTGVGKTATAILLSEYFFGHGQKSKPLIRFDMSEFQHVGQVERLIGSSGAEPGKLIQFVREHPFCVVLFDEIEKANLLIYDALLTTFDEGMLTDAHGRTTDFRNTIIIMTTNLGSQVGESIGLGKSKKRDYLRPIKNFFRPEFFNRIDHILTFNPLDKNGIRNIAINELNALQFREGFDNRNITLSFTEATTDFIAITGFDKNFGARPLQRAIEHHIITKLAKHLLANKNLKNVELLIDCIDDQIIIK